MTEVLDEAPVENGEQGGDPRILVRSFGAETTMADERTIEVRVVPFDEVATVADPPDFRPYKEQFMPRVFERQEKAANRILLRVGFGHDALDENGYRKPVGYAGVVGHGQEMVSREDGYVARFKMHPGPESETARELVRDHVLTGVSAEFVPLVDRRVGGILQRVKAHLDSVLLTPIPAYSKAQVLAMREEQGHVVIDDELMPPNVDRGLLERCKKLGIALPEHLAALIAEDDEEVDDSQS